MTEALANIAIRSTETRTFNGDGCPTEWVWDRVNERYGITPTPRSYFERGTLGHNMIEVDLIGGDPYIAFDEYVKPEGEWLETTKCTKEDLLYEVDATFTKWQGQLATLEEYEDYLSVDTEVTLECTTPNGTTVSTQADAIFWFANGPALVDWKLGTSKSGSAMQLFVYWYVMRKSGFITDDAPFRAWFHYATYNQPIVHIVGYPGDEFVETYIDEADRARREGPYLPNPDWFRCSQCEWKDKCPLWGGDYKETQEIGVVFV